MSSTPSLRRTVIATAALAIGALGLPAMTALAAPGPDTTPTVIAGTSEDQAAYKRASTTLSARASLRTQAVPTSTSYRFSTVMDGKPVRFNPCAPIRWTSSTARGPVGGLAVLQEAVARVAAVSGTTWTYVGPAAAEPHSKQLPKAVMATYPPVNIGWSDTARSDLLASTAASSLGVARTKWLGMAYKNGSRKAVNVGAVVALDRTKRLPLRGGTSWKAVALHELGHAMGLAHVADRTQLLNAALPAGLGDLQAGDRAGLVALGRSAGCVVIPGI